MENTSLAALDQSSQLNEYLQINDSDLIEVVPENLNEDLVIDLTISSSTKTTTSTTTHFQGNPLIPVYSPGTNRPFYSKNIAEKIINGISTHLVSSLIPHQADEDIAFMIGTQS